KKGVRLVKDVHETPWGTREFAVKDDQGHTLYFGQRQEENTVTRRLISSGSSFEKEIAFSRADVDGDLIFVSGTTCFAYRSMTISESVTDQAEQCLRNSPSALEEDGDIRGDVGTVDVHITEM